MKNKPLCSSVGRAAVCRVINIYKSQIMTNNRWSLVQFQAKRIKFSFFLIKFKSNFKKLK